MTKRNWQDVQGLGWFVALVLVMALTGPGCTRRSAKSAPSVKSADTSTPVVEDNGQCTDPNPVPIVTDKAEEWSKATDKDVCHDASNRSPFHAYLYEMGVVNLQVDFLSICTIYAKSTVVAENAAGDEVPTSEGMSIGCLALEKVWTSLCKQGRGGRRRSAIKALLRVTDQLEEKLETSESDWLSSKYCKSAYPEPTSSNQLVSRR